MSFAAYASFVLVDSFILGATFAAFMSINFVYVVSMSEANFICMMISLNCVCTSITLDHVGDVLDLFRLLFMVVQSLQRFNARNSINYVGVLSHVVYRSMTLDQCEDC